jgi:Leucine-rich repeat (LRR) protein
MIAGDAFNYSFKLQELSLDNNLLTVVPSQLVENLPALQKLTVTNNAIVALPETSNHIARSKDFAGNPLQCSSYGPRTVGCRCPASYSVESRFGYTQCTLTSTPNGCPPGTFFNTSDSSKSPWSVCVADVPDGLFYNNAENIFLPVTVCNRAFRMKGTTNQYLSAYQVLWTACTMLLSCLP